MHCSVKDGNVRYHEDCEREVEWVVEVLGLGYPSHRLTTVRQEAYCALHFLGFMADVVAERIATTAGLRVVRLAHWNRVDEQRRLEGR